MPGFKPAPSPVGIEEKLGLRKEPSKVEDEGNREIKRLSSEGDASDRFISEWLERVEGSYLRHQQHKEEMKQNSIKVGCQSVVSQGCTFVHIGFLSEILSL